WFYFPLTLAIKLTVAWLGLIALLLLWQPRAMANWPCMTAAVLLLLSTTFKVQLGVRYLLPLYALVAVGLAVAAVATVPAAAPAWPRRAAVAAVAGALVWSTVASVRVWPDGLAYVNELWGGTAEGYRLVGDSNYDWGQGVKQLARWQAQHGVTR